ncbi:hypothetical protein GUY44_18830, partial [Pimelobacter simplex]
MSSVTDNEPEPEDSRLDDARPGRGRGRRGRLWRRQDDDAPVVADLDPDEVAELLRRSNTSVAPDDAPDAPGAGDWSDVIDRSLGRPLTEIDPEEFEVTPPSAADDPSLRGTLTDRLERMRSDSEPDSEPDSPARAEEPAEVADESHDWAAVISRSTSRPFGDAHGLAAPEPELAAEPAAEPDLDPLTSETWIIEEAEPQPEPQADPATAELPDQRRTDEEAGQRVIADAFDGGFAEPTPVAQPKGLARLRRRPGGSSAAPRPEARPLQEFVEPPLLDEPIPHIDQAPEVPRRPSEVLAHARAEIEAELVESAPPAASDESAGAEPEVVVPDNAEVVAALAARLRRDAELAAAEQAAERAAAEEAAQRA